MTPAERRQRIAELDAATRYYALTHRWESYYPDTGPLRRELYPKHLAFFSAGATHRQRLMLAANRIGKTEGVGLYEVVAHATGNYPAWWEGRRFTRPVRVWVCGDTSKTIREILQIKLLGPMGQWGTGLLPADKVERVTRQTGVADAVEGVVVRHAFGGESSILFKSYDQRREAFQGTEQDVILLDEEPPLDIYTECLLRTMTNSGMLLLTFTPLQGLSETVLAFLPDGDVERADPHRYVITATWDDVPHLDDAAKKELLASIPPFQRDARSKGVPQLGAGAILPVPETDILVPDFEIPPFWPRSFGFDVGWARTAAIWGAIDRESGVSYLYSEHYRGESEPVVHAASIKDRGGWIPGAIDPASRGRSQKDGENLLALYRGLGLTLWPAANAVESGLFTLWQLLSSGKLKVFRSCQNWFSEYRLYRRNEKGQVVKERDHLMDATRYWVMTGRDIATIEARPKVGAASGYRGAESWMG